MDPSLFSTFEIKIQGRPFLGPERRSPLFFFKIFLRESSVSIIVRILIDSSTTYFSAKITVAVSALTQEINNLPSNSEELKLYA
jgi:hypothetical protein